MGVDIYVILGCLVVGAMLGASLNQPWWGSTTTDRMPITEDEHAHLVNSGARVHVHETLLNRRLKGNDGGLFL